MTDRPCAPLQSMRRLAGLLFASDDSHPAGDSAFDWLSADPVFAAAPAPMTATVAAVVAHDESSVAPPPPFRRRAALA